MRLAISVGYTHRGQLQGKKTVRAHRFAELVTVDIPEVTPEEAPLAVSWKALPSPEAGGIPGDEVLCVGDRNGEQHTRWYGGQHWLSLVGGHIDPASRRDDTAPLTGEMLSRAIAGGMGYRMIDMGNFSPNLRGMRGVEVASDPTGQFVQTVVSERKKALDAAECLSRKLLVVGGAVHVACAQPAIRVTRRRGGEKLPMAVETRGEIVDDAAGYSRGCLVFPLGNWDALAAELVTASSQPAVAAGAFEYWRPIVHIPESLDQRIDARREADTLFKQFVSAADRPGTVEAAGRYFRGSITERADWLESALERNRGVWEDAFLPVELLDRALEILRDEEPVDLDLGAPQAHAPGSRP